MRSTGGWQWGGAGLLRVSTDPGNLDLPDDLDLADPAAAAAWAAQVWTRDEIRAALNTVSPALCRQLDMITELPGRDPAGACRAATALASYLLRWQRRPTPLGPLAGVGPIRIGGPAKVRFGVDHRLSVRADCEWLAEVSAGLHRSPELLERLPVVANNAVVRRGTRLVAPGVPPTGNDKAEALAESSVRATRPAIAALSIAATPIRFGDLQQQLAAMFPTATPRQIRAVLSGLAEQQFLITALRIPLTEPDALTAVCAVLREAEAEDIPQIAGLVADLHAVCDTLAGGLLHTVPPGLTERMDAIRPAARTPLIIDTAADCEIQLPEAVAREARDAVDVLYRLSPFMGGYPPWRDYQTAFRARYGTGALVPVLDLTADSGLGLPTGFIGSPRERGPRQMSERDDKLLALVQQATVTGGEIVLTSDLIEHLASAPVDPDRLPPRTEVAFAIRAASLEDISAGRFALELTGTPRPASSMVGRHAHLLPEPDQARIRATFTTPAPDTVIAQLSFVPRWRRSENVARTTVLAAAVIGIGEHRGPGDDVIDMADLAVTAEGADLHLIQISTGRRVAGQIASALEAASHTPPLARFLSEAASACHPTYSAFAFGAASALPYLPCVRYRRTILAPARWLLKADQLPGRDADALAWEAALSDWRERWRVPDHVSMVDHERAQPIDLRHRAHRLLLRTRLDRGGHLELRECAAPDAAAWIGRAHELLLIMTSAATAPATRSISTMPPVVDGADLHLPAVSPVLALRVGAHPERFEEILADHLPSLIDACSQPVSAWWFHRHRDLSDHRAAQHLAIFLHLSDDQAFGHAAAQAASWAGLLHRDRLVSTLMFADWQPPTGRYGHGSALTAALEVFAADSQAAIAQLNAARTADLRLQSLAAASYLDLAAALAGDPAIGRDWLLREIPQTNGHLNPDLRDQTLALANRLGPLNGTEAGQIVADAWSRRAAALGGYATALSAQREPISVLEPLLHLHHLRVVGAYPDSERATGRLARALALRQEALTGAGR
ncbi:MAG: lantibiotic dehydratase [Catenulispora sp.]|nr:lantibiotic dehydratase [Catenulispora sp.]NUR57241.1 lantibiotic dehydratase [Catenulispora sp.]